jgi:DNA-binding NarL/FixJ family response regulator
VPAEGSGPGEPRELNRLLIVEDHELLSGTLALALRQRGLQVDAVTGPTAEAVVDRARQLAPVLVLLDLDLGPALGDGVDLVAPLVAAGSRVVIMSGDTSRSRLGACVEAGASGIVGKASRFENLVDTIQRAAEGAAVLGEDERQHLLADLRASRAAESRRMAPFARLTPREQAVLAGLVAGESAETIAERSYVSVATIRSQIRSILQKLGVNSQLAAVALARDAGWSPPP